MADTLDEFVQAQASDGFILVPHMNPVGTASVLIGFVGHCRDTFVKIDGAWRYEERIVERWAGDVLDGFPEFGPVA